MFPRSTDALAPTRGLFHPMAPHPVTKILTFKWIATLAAIRADEEVPILNAEAPHSAARSPAEIINAALDLEVKQ